MSEMNVRMVDLRRHFEPGQQFAIVGGYGDIGLHAAEQLVRRGYDVLVLGRSELTMSAAVQKLWEQMITKVNPGIQLASLRLDWHNAHEVRQFVAELQNYESRPSVIVLSQGDYRVDQMFLEQTQDTANSPTDERMAIQISVDHHCSANVTSKIRFAHEYTRRWGAEHLNTQLFMIGSIAKDFDPRTPSGRAKLRREFAGQQCTQIGYAYSQKVLYEATVMLQRKGCAHYIPVPLIAGNIRQIYFPEVPPEQCTPIDVAVWDPIAHVLDQCNL